MHKVEFDELTKVIIGGAIQVHRELGPGLLESAYEECLHYEIKESGLFIERQKPLPITYRSVKLDCGYRMDLVVEKKILIELKAVDRVLPIHDAQVISYLKLSGMKLGLFINFHVKLLKDGLKRIVNNF